jgi:Icc protein
MSTQAQATRIAEYPRPSHFLLHLSDTHLITGDGLLYDSVDADSHLRRVFEEFEAAGARPEAIVFTGDLADKGDPAAYAKLRSIVEPAAARMGARVIWVMGNHDKREQFRSLLLDKEPSNEPVDEVHWIGGLRIIVLDSTVPGYHHGEITDAQLEWLRSELATPAVEGTILALHHPPMPDPVYVNVGIELQDQHKLADVVRGSDIRSILAGHLHYSTNTTFAGIPLSVASATCYTNTVTEPEGSTLGVDGAQSINLVPVYEEQIVHTIMPVHTFPTLYETNGDLMRLFNALTAEQQVAMLAMPITERMAYVEALRAN